MGVFGIGAGDRIRTGDIDLGKVALYQLSYSRACGGKDLKGQTHCRASYGESQIPVNEVFLQRHATQRVGFFRPILATNAVLMFIKDLESANSGQASILHNYSRNDGPPLPARQTSTSTAWQNP